MKTRKEVRMALPFEKAMEVLSSQWSKLNWDFRDVSIGNKTEKISQWQGDPEDDVMVVVYKGKEIHEPFHRQDFFFLDYAYHNSYDALSADFDNLITIKEYDCYIGQPYSGYALRGESKDDDIIMIGVHIRKEVFFREYLPAFSTDPDMFRFFLEPEKDRFSNEFIHIPLEPECPIRTLLKLMVIEYAEKDSDSQALLKTMLMSIFLHVARKYRLLNSGREEISEKDRIVEYIAAHPDTATLSEVAARFSYHPNYISAMLHKEYGIRFSDLVLKSRMKRALALLRATDLSNEEIAGMLGYSNTSNYYKAFKQYYGCTPSFIKTQERNNDR